MVTKIYNNNNLALHQIDILLPYDIAALLSNLSLNTRGMDQNRVDIYITLHFDMSSFTLNDRLMDLIEDILNHNNSTWKEGDMEYTTGNLIQFNLPLNCLELNLNDIYLPSMKRLLENTIPFVSENSKSVLISELLQLPCHSYTITGNLLP